MFLWKGRHLLSAGGNCQPSSFDKALRLIHHLTAEYIWFGQLKRTWNRIINLSVWTGLKTRNEGGPQLQATWAREWFMVQIMIIMYIICLHINCIRIQCKSEGVPPILLTCYSIDLIIWQGFNGFIKALGRLLQII